MKQEMTKPEKGLIWSAFVFALIAALMVVLPWLATAAFAHRSANPELGGAAFGMTFGLMMMAFGAFSWFSSLIMLTVNAISNRRAFQTGIGITTCILDVGVLLYAGFLVSTIAGDLMK
jgi:hypothetical protein